MSEFCVGVTGAGGFIGQHLARRLSADAAFRVECCPRAAWDDPQALDRFAAGCDAIVHLAGVNRGDDREIAEVNAALVEKLLTAAERCARPPHIVFASSTQRDRDTAYGRVKRQCEERLAAWVAGSWTPSPQRSADGARSGADTLSSRGRPPGKRRVTVLVIPNVYGPGCRPFYNSVVATFCHQLVRGEEPTVTGDTPVDFVWINDLVEQIAGVAVPKAAAGFETVIVRKTGTLRPSELLAKLRRFHQSRFADGVVPDLSDRFDATLCATLESYLDLDRHAWRPQVHADDRGRLFEIVKLAGGGQVFFSTTKPGVVRGRHYHTRKLEWFCVVEGEAAIRLRRVGTNDVREFRVSGRQPEFVSIPIWHVHEIENTGDSDLLTMFWTSEIFDADDPDTYYEKVA